VARHERAYGRGYQVLNLEHYLDVLEKKPGAMADAAGTMTGSRALDGEPGPDLGAVAGAPQRVRRHARDDHAGARRPRRRLGQAAKRGRGGAAVGLDGCGRGAVSVEHARSGKAGRYELALKEDLEQLERPMPKMAEYDLLLSGGSKEVIQ
jgi:hypothetical protein